MHDLETAGIARGNILQGRDRALVMLDGDDASGAEREQGARQPARTRTDLDDGGVLERSRRTRDARGEIEVEEEVLAERFARRQSVLANDLAKRREVVDRAHRVFAAAIRLASLNAAIRLAGLALPVPAMSKAVPWSGEVRMKGRPSVTLTASSKATVLIGISAWSWYMQTAQS